MGSTANIVHHSAPPSELNTAETIFLVIEMAPAVIILIYRLHITKYLFAKQHTTVSLHLHYTKYTQYTQYMYKCTSWATKNLGYSYKISWTLQEDNKLLISNVPKSSSIIVLRSDANFVEGLSGNVQKDRPLQPPPHLSWLQVSTDDTGKQGRAPVL